MTSLKIIWGERINKAYSELIKSDTNDASIALELTLFEGKKRCDLEYVVAFEKNTDLGIIITQETLYKKSENDARKINFITYKRADKSSIFTIKNEYTK